MLIRKEGPLLALPRDPRAISVLVIDDHELLASALLATFTQSDRVDPIGSAASLRDGIEAAAALRPMVILADRRLPDGDTDQHLAELVDASPESRVLIMTGWLTKRSSLAALDAGAHGIVSKSQPIAQIIDAIARVVAGELVIPAELAPALLARGAQRGSPHRSELSVRELDVLEALARGESTIEIAARLCISHHTTRNHLARAMLKLGAHDRLSAVIAAMQLALITPQLPGSRPADHSGRS